MIDRIIEQAIVQVLTPIVEPHFSEYSYGFRPSRSAQQAIMKLLKSLLSNITLNELDKELEAREIHFVRYADDCIIAVGSKTT